MMLPRLWVCWVIHPMGFLVLATGSTGDRQIWCKSYQVQSSYWVLHEHVSILGVGRSCYPQRFAKVPWILSAPLDPSDFVYFGQVFRVFSYLLKRYLEQNHAIIQSTTSCNPKLLTFVSFSILHVCHLTPIVQLWIALTVMPAGNGFAL